jgi:hypothetical protein
MNTIWYKDVKSFLDPQTLHHFVPKKTMTFAEQLNSLFRLSIYFAVLLYFLKRNYAVLYIAVGVGLFTAFMWSTRTWYVGKKKELYSKMGVTYDKKNKRMCYTPKKDNPFMNVLMNEYDEFPNRPQACDIEVVKKSTEKMFDQNLYRDVDDVWQRKSSSRNWHTMPVTTIPNDSVAFAKALYNKPSTCKSGNGMQCYTNLHRELRV